MIEIGILFCGVMGCFGLGYWMGRRDGYDKGFELGSAEVMAWVHNREMTIKALQQKRIASTKNAAVSNQLG